MIRTKNAQITLEQEVLLQDIKDMAWVEGETMEEANPNRHLLQDICEEGSIDRVKRLLGTATDDIIELLYPLTKRWIGNSTVKCDFVKETSSYVITLVVPDDYSNTSLNVIKNYTHEYLIDVVMIDFTSRLNPDTTETWQAKAEGAKSAITGVLNNRINRVRRTLTPF